jgi:hypothetical protein
MERYTVLVTGGRDYTDRAKVFAELDKVAAQVGPSLFLICGGASGADRLAIEWKVARGYEAQVYLANWGRYPRGGGVIRNEEMLRKGKPDLVLAFPGGNGTADMVRRAKKAGVPVVEFDRDT